MPFSRLLDGADSRETSRSTHAAAIQSAYAARRAGLPTPWPTIAKLYDALVQVTSSKGARVARAVAIARATEPYHAARAALLLEGGHTVTAGMSLQRAIELCAHGPSRRYLEQQIGSTALSTPSG